MLISAEKNRVKPAHAAGLLTLLCMWMGCAPSGDSQPAQGDSGAATAGESSGSLQATSLDTTPPLPPTILQPHENGWVNTPRPIIQGVSEAFSTVTIYEANIPLGTTEATVRGEWIFAPIIDMPPGHHSIAATATDAAGNTSQLSPHVTFAVDLTPPEAPVIVSPVSNSWVVTQPNVFTGTAEPSSIVMLYINGIFMAATTVDALGTWSRMTVLPDGAYTATVTATDVAGNTSPSSATIHFNVDTAAPNIPIVLFPSQGSKVNTGRLTFGGTSEPRSLVSIFVNGILQGSTIGTASGEWQLTLTDPLSQGSHAISATATDPAGNISPASVPVTFTVDSIPPSLPVVVSPVSHAWLNTRTPVFRGASEPFTTVQLFVDGFLMANIAVDDVGNWAGVMTMPLIDGSHTATVTATDVAGNTSPSSAPIHFNVDTVVPNIPAVFFPSQGSKVNTGRPTFSGACEPHSIVRVFVNGQLLGPASTTASGDWSFALVTPLPDGPSYVLKVDSVDRAGNTSPLSGGIHFEVDTFAPLPPVVTRPANRDVLNKAQPLFQGTAEVGTTVAVVIDSRVPILLVPDSSGNWQYVPAIDLSDGDHIVRAHSTDGAGNTSLSAEIHFTVDATAPSAPVVMPPATSGDLLIFTGTAEAGSLVTLYVNGLVVGKAVSDTQGRWSFNQRLLLPDGSHVLQATATDPAGNVSPFSQIIVFIVDTVAPPAPEVTSILNGASLPSTQPVIRGTAVPGSAITVLVDNTSAGSTHTDATGQWSVSLPAPLTEGPHRLKVIAADAAGNSSSTEVSFTVDTMSPGLPVLTSLTEGAFINDSTPVLFGSAEVGSSIQVVVDGNLVRTSRADATGTWSINIDAALSDGVHTLTLSVADASGNTVSSTLTFTVDLIAPETLLSEYSPRLQASSAIFEFSTEGGSTFKCSLDEADFVPCASPITFENLEAGPHNFRVRAEDRAGNMDLSPATSNWTQAPEDGGKADEGGCSTSGGTASALPGWLALALLAAGRRHGKNAAPKPCRTAALRVARWP